MYLISNEQMMFVRRIVEAFSMREGGTLREFNERRRARILLRGLKAKRPVGREKLKGI